MISLYNSDVIFREKTPQNRGITMQHKNIKRIIKKQLKTNYPYWRNLPKKEKKVIAKSVLEEVVRDYDFSQTVEAPLEELIEIEGQLPTAGIMNLEKMANFIDSFNGDCFIGFQSKDRINKYIQDDELKYINDLFDDRIINTLLSYHGYTPSMREFFPSQFFRAELLKAIKYPEFSYRKFCSDECMGMERKRNRIFMGLPLNKKSKIDHTQLCQFRSSLTFVQLVNLLVYVLHHFFRSGLLNEFSLHGVDSTELANFCKTPLASLKINGKKIRIYNDLDCDCGKRRNKRDKSSYVVGYRLHVLTAIDAETGHSFPLIPMLAPANHHDSLFLKPLVQLAQAMGIDLKLVSADEAYNDKDGSLREIGVELITPVSSKAKLPEHVDSETKAVMCNDFCEIPMQRVGSVKEGHEFKCAADQGECFHSELCSKFREIPFDSGYFQPMFHGSEHSEKSVGIRKNAERPNNLLKNQTGLEDVRVRSQHALLARTIFSNIGTLLLEMAGTRRKKKQKKKQGELFDEAA
jgi:hypothetical protein